MRFVVDMGLRVVGYWAGSCWEWSSYTVGGVVGWIMGGGWILQGWLWIGLEFGWSWVKGVVGEGSFVLFWFVDVTNEWSKSFIVYSMTVWNTLNRWSMVLTSAVLLRCSCSLISWLYEVSISLLVYYSFPQSVLGIRRGWKMIELYSHRLIELMW